MEFRRETDSVGCLNVPADAYYGIHALRAKHNFHITGLPLHHMFISNLARVKKAAAITNRDAGDLDKNIAEAIVAACEEIVQGKLRDSFIVDAIQGGAGTSANMNANEVIANRAIEILGGVKGDYTVVHPNDHVNMSQSTNDVIPTTGKLTTIELVGQCIEQLTELHNALLDKAEEFQDIIKMARTQLQDAVPMRLGQTFDAYANAVLRSMLILKNSIKIMNRVNLGGTAVGTGLNASRYYLEHIIPNLNSVCGSDLVMAEDLFDATENLDYYVRVSGGIKACAITMSKMASDLRLLSSGPLGGLNEINLPPRQSGSSIMPGKVNPVIPEVMNQVAFMVMGNDVTISLAAEGGQLELNAFEPVLFFKMFLSLESLANAIHTLTENCIRGITANRDRCMQIVESSPGLATALSPEIGYVKAAEIAKRSHNEKRTVREIALEEGLSPEMLDKLLDVAKMTRPEI